MRCGAGVRPCVRADAPRRDQLRARGAELGAGTELRVST
jgi:hypothetical protein